MLTDKLELPQFDCQRLVGRRNDCTATGDEPCMPVLPTGHAQAEAADEAEITIVNGYQCVWTTSLAGSQGAPSTRAKYSGGDSGNGYQCAWTTSFAGSQGASFTRATYSSNFLRVRRDPIRFRGRQLLMCGRRRRRRRREATTAATARGGRSASARREPCRACPGGNGGLHTRTATCTGRALGLRSGRAAIRPGGAKGKQECHTTGVPGVSRSWGAAAEGACMTLCVIPQLTNSNAKRNI